MASFQTQESKMSGNNLEDLRFLDTICAQLCKWASNNSPLLSTFSVPANFQVVSQTARDLHAKDDKEQPDIVLTGTTSAGKSLLINALLRQEIMRSGVGHTTPGAVCIAATDLPRAYFTSTASRSRFPIDFTDESSLQAFHDKVDAVNGETDGVRLFLPRPSLHDKSVVRNGAILIDTPGMEREIFGRADTREIVEEADVIVLVVDLMSGLNDEKTRALLEESGFLVRPNLLVVFNKADKMQKETAERESQLLNAALTEMAEVLGREKGVFATTQAAKQALFVVSAKEVRKSQAREKKEPGGFRRKLSKKFEEAKNKKKMSFGYRESGNEFSTDEAVREEGFQMFEKRLFEIARGQWKTHKTCRVRRALVKRVEELMEEIRRLVRDMIVLEKKLGLLITTNDDGKDRQKEFVVDFYNTETPDGEISMAGKEKVLKFLTACKCKGREVFSKSVLNQELILDVHLKSFVDQRLQKAMEMITERERATLDYDYSVQLDPIEERCAETDKSVEEIRKRRDGLAASIEEEHQRRLKIWEKEKRAKMECGNFNGDIDREDRERKEEIKRRHDDALQDLPVRQAQLNLEIAEKERAFAERREKEVLERRVGHQKVLRIILEKLITKVSATLADDFNSKILEMKASREKLQRYEGQATSFHSDVKKKL